MWYCRVNLAFPVVAVGDFVPECVRYQDIPDELAEDEVEPDEVRRVVAVYDDAAHPGVREVVPECDMDVCGGSCRVRLVADDEVLVLRAWDGLERPASDFFGVAVFTL